jgi:hypothetical protein
LQANIAILLGVKCWTLAEMVSTESNSSRNIFSICNCKYTRQYNCDHNSKLRDCIIIIIIIVLCLFLEGPVSNRCRASLIVCQK